MRYKIIFTPFFIKQIYELDEKSKRMLDKKVELLKNNPFRYKRIKHNKLFLFRIRFESRRKEKRAIYSLNKDIIEMLFIIDRDKEYKDLREHLRKISPRS